MYDKTDNIHNDKKKTLNNNDNNDSIRCEANCEAKWAAAVRAESQARQQSIINISMIRIIISSSSIAIMIVVVVVVVVVVV